jgi:hypothetical protein
MTDTKSLFGDDILDRAIHAIMMQTVPAQARSQSIEKAIAAQTPHKQIHPRRLRRFRATIIEIAIAASVFIAVGVILLPALQKARSQKQSDFYAKETKSPAAPPVQGNIPNAVSPAQDDFPRAAYMSANVNILVADNAPVLLSNGPDRPIQLGAQIPQSETAAAMQVWNWKTSATSQIIATSEEWPGSHAAISPDGEFVVRADGRIKYLFQKVFSIKPPESIDLGGAGIPRRSFHLHAHRANAILTRCKAPRVSRDLP